MALIDSEASEILIRLVYDGPPEAGKTTSLRALASSLTRPTYSPAEDGDGRTLWFDWMEYVGGRFEGCQIRCQIVSVAGQRELAARRRRVIAGADVVVFVADSAANETARTVAYLQELREMLRLTPGSGSEAVAHRLTAHEVPVGVIVQANKRDLPDAIPIKQLRGELENIGWPIGVVESVASEGTGIREAFVYAVRLALDRVREQMHRGGLPTEGNGPRTPEELLRVMRAEDEALHQAPPIVVTPAADSLAAELIRDVLASEAPSEVQEPPADDARLAATPADDVAAEAGAANPPVADARPEPALAEKAPEPAAPVLLPKLPPLPKPPTRGQVTMPPKPPSLTPPHPIPAVIPLVASAVHESQNVPVVAKPRPLEPVDDQWSASLDEELEPALAAAEPPAPDVAPAPPAEPALAMPPPANDDAARDLAPILIDDNDAVPLTFSAADSDHVIAALAPSSPSSEIPTLHPRPGATTPPPTAAPPPPALDDAAAATRTPNPPTTNVPSGAIWPPVEGRALLQEISTVDLVPRRLAHGDWVAGLGSGWRVMSSRDALYPTLDHGRSALIQWARLHASAASILSSHRCIVLSDDGTGRWRLWQLVRAEPSLREAVDDAFFEDGREAVIAGLRRVAQWLVDADAQLASLPVALPCTLENLGPGDGGVSYIGFMPDANTAPTPPRPRDPLTALLTALEPIIAHELVERGIDLEEIIGHIQPSAADRQDTPTLLGA